MPPINIRHLSNYSVNRLVRYAVERKIISKKRIDKMNREEIKERIVAELTKSAMIIQRNFRRFLAIRQLNDLKVQKLPPKCHNSETLLGDNITDIPTHYLYSSDGYVFDLREIKTLYKNPYTNIPFEIGTMNQIYRILGYLRNAGYPVEIDNDIPISSELTALTSSFFNRLTDLKSYPNMELFIKFNHTKLFYYFNYICKFQLIQDVIYLGDIMEIQRLYRSCSIDIFDDNGDVDDKACEKIEANIQTFRYFVLHVLMVMVEFRGDFKEELRALILSEAIRDDIIDAYNNKDYRNFL